MTLECFSFAPGYGSESCILWLRCPMIFPPQKWDIDPPKDNKTTRTRWFVGPFSGPHVSCFFLEEPMSTLYITCWWFGTMEFYDFPFSWEFHNPNWRTHIFQMGRYTTNQIIDPCDNFFPIEMGKFIAALGSSGLSQSVQDMSDMSCGKTFTEHSDLIDHKRDRIGILIGGHLLGPTCSKLWLVVWNIWIIFPIILGISSSQLTNSMIFSEGLKPPTRMDWWPNLAAESEFLRAKA